MFKFDESMIGKKVRFIDAKAHESAPRFYPEVGTVGEIVGVEENDWAVQWPEMTVAKGFSGKYRWFCGEDEIELIEDSEKISNEEIWQMLKPKMEKNGLEWEHYGYDDKGNPIYLYKDIDVQKAIAIAYRSGYERCMKGRPFKFEGKKAENEG